MHNCLSVEYDEKNPRVLGLANQRIWERNDDNIVARKEETRAQKNRRKGKESEHWLKTLKNIGPPPKGVKWVSIGDRGNDIYEFFSGLEKLKWDAVVRASQDRLVEVAGEQQCLMNWVSSLPVGGTRTIRIKGKGDTKPKEVEMSVSWGEVKVCPPKRVGSNAQAVKLWLVRCYNEKEEIDWVLYSTIPVSTLEEAKEKIQWYACRWIIEEYHKCLKTG